MFPDAPIENIKANLPVVLKALEDDGLSDRDMVLYALAALRAESPNFIPLTESKSRFNTSPGGEPFDLYDNRKSMGNLGPPDGERFRGRGFIWLVGRFNYSKYGALIGMGNQLVENPDLASQPEIAARLLSSILKASEPRVRTALAAGDFRQARRVLTGGYHGLGEFTKAFQAGSARLQ